MDHVSKRLDRKTRDVGDVHSNSDTSRDTGENRKKDVGSNVLHELAPVMVALTMAVRLAIVMWVRAMVRTLAFDGGVGMITRLSVATASTLDLLEELLHLGLDAEQRVLVLLLGSLLKVDAADDDLAGWRLDKSDADGGHAIHKVAADFDDA